MKIIGSIGKSEPIPRWIADEVERLKRKTIAEGSLPIIDVVTFLERIRREIDAENNMKIFTRDERIIKSGIRESDRGE